MSARETGDLPTCVLCGSLNGIIDRQVMPLSITRGPGHRELWSVMACDRCAVAIVEKNTEGGAPIRKDGGCGESSATFSPPSVPPPAPAQAGWTEEQIDAAISIASLVRLHEGLENAWSFEATRAKNLLICARLAEIAPHFAKVRVKLPEPEKTNPIQFRAPHGGISDDDDMDPAAYERGRKDAWPDGYNRALADCAAALRSAGVEIEGEQ